MLGATTRIVLVGVATVMLLAGLGGVALGGQLAVPGLWMVVSGAVALVAVAIERNRYRSEDAEHSFETAGPGGGEPTRDLDPRFRHSNETFIDPTSGTRMRVFVDGRTGERRYVADD